MSAALDDEVLTTSVTGAEPTIRVAVREIREVAFRAFVSAGGSAAEAKAAAEQVLFTELHHGSGLVALLEELSLGRWSPVGLRCERDDAGGRLVLRVSGSTRAGSLGHGVLLLDLLAAGTEPTAVVVSDGLTALSPLLEEPLIRTARTTGSWIVAAKRTSSGLDFHVGSPDGSIGVGTAERTDRLDPNHDALPVGVSLVRCDLRPAGAVTWLSAGEQQATRTAAAQHGRTVHAASWRQVASAAREYLVPG